MFRKIVHIFLVLTVILLAGQFNSVQAEEPTPSNTPVPPSITTVPPSNTPIPPSKTPTPTTSQPTSSPSNTSAPTQGPSNTPGSTNKPTATPVKKGPTKKPVDAMPEVTETPIPSLTFAPSATPTPTPTPSGNFVGSTFPYIISILGAALLGVSFYRYKKSKKLSE